jgi:hypothetical protein
MTLLLIPLAWKVVSFALIAGDGSIVSAFAGAAERLSIGNVMLSVSGGVSGIGVAFHA